MKNLSDLKSQISFSWRHNWWRHKMGFLVMRSTNPKIKNLKEKLKTNTKWKSQLIIFYSLRDICNIPRIFLNKLWTHFVADF